ncbi:MAG TPA: CaiB/BaiF CoA-transferase family protein [Dehalococcoidia bacterium]|nr:CaiB/BaiF CoA-transferase family protein [Dehalococcoidia bacterium]
MRPLEGIRVLDLSRLIPGPYCSLLLADMGAEVIKVEDPQGGDHGRQTTPFIGGMSSRFLLLNRNKKSIALNLKSQEGRRIFLRLAEKADVILESFRPGTMDKFGLEYEKVSAVNPRIIYCSISAYGQDGPYRDIVAHDVNILGLAGLLDITGGRDGQPVIPGVTIADNAAAMFAALGILAALLAREKTGRGRFLDVSMLDSVMSWLFDSVQYQLALGRTPGKSEGRLWGGVPLYGVYETKDGKFVTLGSLEPKFKEQLLKKLGREDLIADRGTLSEVGVATNEELAGFLRSTFLTRTQEEWVRELEPLNICFSPVNTIGEALSHPQVVSRRMVMEVDDPVAGHTRVIGDPLKVSEPPVEPGPAPLLGQHTGEFLAGLGYTDSQIEELRLEGVVGVSGS